MKIRTRISLLYFFSTLFLMILFIFGSYFSVRHLLYRTLDEELDTITNSIVLNYDPQSGFFRDFSDDQYNLNKYLKKFYLIIYDLNRKIIYRSPLAKKMTLDVPLVQKYDEMGYTIHKRRADIPTFQLENIPPHEEIVAFRVLSRKLYYNGNHLGWVTLALGIEDIESSLKELLKIFLSGAILIVLAVGISSYILTKQSLNPVSKITRKANQISHSNLDERIDIKNNKDELGQLSLVLNNLFARLQNAFESQKQFLSDAAHELKTPLSMLRAHWESEINNPEIPIVMKEKFVQDVETISRLNHLINNLLLLSQTESIQTSFDFQLLQLDKLMREVISDTKILAELKQQEISIVELSEIKILGDKLRLYQLFFNLIDNAIKYTPEGGKIWISLRIEKNKINIMVRDTGLGISTEHLPHIFERFYRVEKDRARKTGGSGLGLSICKLITEAHNGLIQVESETGKGTVFVVEFPLPQ